jgi:hypothetical protein
MAKYSEKAGEKVEKTMHEMKEGKLKSGSGKKVTSKKQAVAIGLSEARKEGAKVPKKKSQLIVETRCIASLRVHYWPVNASSIFINVTASSMGQGFGPLSLK